MFEGFVIISIIFLFLMLVIGLLLLHRIEETVTEMDVALRRVSLAAPAATGGQESHARPGAAAPPAPHPTHTPAAPGSGQMPGVAPQSGSVPVAPSAPGSGQTPGVAPQPPPGAPDRPMLAPAAYSPMASAPVARIAVPDGAPVQPPPSQPLTAPPTQAPPAPPTALKTSAENVFGRNIVGIVASVLIFLGLIYLGYVVVPYMNDAQKIIAMFATSAVLTLAGYLLNHRYSNNFTQALLGTGLGAFFISVLVTHLYFHAINEIVAFSLLAVWTAGCLLISRQANSLLIAIIAHVGMVASVCAGYGVGLTDDRLLELMIYQFVSTAIIVVGNIWCCRRMYRFGLFATLALMGYSSVVMVFQFLGPWTVDFASSLPTAFILTAFIVQFAGGSFLSYLLFTSCARVKNIPVAVWLQAINVLLWLALLALDIAWPAAKLAAMTAGVESALPFTDTYPQILVGTNVSCVVMGVAAAGTILIRRSLRFPEPLESVTVLLLAGVCAVQLLTNLLALHSYDVPGPHLSYLAIPGLLVLAGGRLAGNRNVSIGGRLLLIGDAALMAVPGLGIGYESLISIGTLWLAVGYLVVLSGLSFVVWRGFTPAFRKTGTAWYRVAMLGAFEVSLASIVVRSDAAWGWALWALVSIVVLGAAHLAKYDVPAKVYHWSEFAVALIVAGQCVWGVDDTLSRVLRIVAAVIAFVLLLERIRCRAAANARAAREGTQPEPDSIEYATAIGLTVLLLGVLKDVAWWFTWQSPASLAAMFIALVVIALGFWSRTRALRLYGLVVTIVCVLKLVSWDVWGSGQMVTQVIALIGGGLVCFGISALYNFAVKRFDQTPAPGRPAPGNGPGQPSPFGPDGDVPPSATGPAPTVQASEHGTGGAVQASAFGPGGAVQASAHRTGGAVQASAYGPGAVPQSPYGSDALPPTAHGPGGAVLFAHAPAEHPGQPSYPQPSANPPMQDAAPPATQPAAPPPPPDDPWSSR